MKRFVEKLICDKCKRTVFGLWKEPSTQGQSGEQDYVHKHNMSAFCDYNPVTKEMQKFTENQLRACVARLYRNDLIIKKQPYWLYNDGKGRE